MKTETERAAGYVSAATTSLSIAMRRLPQDHPQIRKLEHIIALAEEVQISL